MSDAGVVAAQELAAATQEIIAGLSADQWAADSACHGWRIQDLVSHMGFFFNFIADPELVLPDNPSGKSERLNDAAVIERADWSPAQVVDYYAEQSAAGLEVLAALQTPELRDQPLEMLDLGTYRMSQLSDAVAFDHLVHLHSDLLAPHGPVASAAQLPIASSIDPAVDWMIAGFAPMCGAAVGAALTGPVGLRLTGATERTFVIRADDDAPGTVTVVESADLPAEVAISDALAFTRWGTRRSAWRSAVTVEGDRARVNRVLDAIDIV